MCGCLVVWGIMIFISATFKIMHKTLKVKCECQLPLHNQESGNYPFYSIADMVCED